MTAESESSTLGVLSFDAMVEYCVRGRSTESIPGQGEGTSLSCTIGGKKKEKRQAARSLEAGSDNSSA